MGANACTTIRSSHLKWNRINFMAVEVVIIAVVVVVIVVVVILSSRIIEYKIFKKTCFYLSFRVGVLSQWAFSCVDLCFVEFGRALYVEQEC